MIGFFGIAVVIIGSRVQVREQGTGLAFARRATHRKPGSDRQMDFPDRFLGGGILSASRVWQSLPYLFADFLRLRKGETELRDDGWCRATTLSVLSRRYGDAAADSGTLARPAVATRLRFDRAMLLPMLALSLLLMNNREKIGSFQNSFAINLVLSTALVFFLFVGIREIQRLLR